MTNYLKVKTSNITNTPSACWQTIGVPLDAEEGDYLIDGEAGFAYVYSCPETGRKFLNFKTEVPSYSMKEVDLELAPEEVELTEDLPAEFEEAAQAGLLSSPQSLLPTPMAMDKEGNILDSRVIGTKVEIAIPNKYLVFTQHFRINNSKLFASITYYVHANYNLVPFDVSVGNSDPSKSDYIEDVDEVFLAFSSGFLPIIDNDIAVSNYPIESWRDLIFKRTLFKGWIGNGQMPAFTGAVFLQDRASNEEWRDATSYFSEPLEALCMHWEELGPFNWLPAKATNLKGGRGEFFKTYQKYIDWNSTTGDVFRDFYLGMGKRPAQTGDHDEYGLMKGQKLLLRGAGAPEHIAEIKRASLYNALRGIHHRELDVSRVTFENHPNCYFWSGQPHYISWKEGWDTLGKDPGSNKFREGIEPHDSSHGNFLYSPIAYVLTGRIIHRTLCYDHAEAIRFERRYDGAHPGLIGIGEARATRAEGSMAYIIWATRQPEYVDFLVKRLNKIVDVMQALHQNHQVYPLHVHGKDNRKLDGKYPFTMPWQWGEGICWLAAALKMTESHSDHQRLAARVNPMLKRTGESWVSTGWWLHESGRWAIGDAIRWMEDGTALPPEAYEEGSGQVNPHFPGTAFDEWNMGALYLVKTLLLDQESELADKAETIYKFLKQFFAERASNGFPKLLDFNPWF